MNWQQILWDLKRDYKHLAAIARELNYSRRTFQMLANGSMKKDLPYSIGVQLITLHKEHCQHDAE